MGRAIRVAVAGAAVMLLVPGLASAKGAPAIAFVPGPTFDYGSIEFGSTGSQAFVLTNSGGVATAVLTVALTGSSAFSISSNTCSATSLGPKKSCSVTVQYSPGSDSEASTTETATLAASSRKPAARATVALSATVGAQNRAPIASADNFQVPASATADVVLGSVLSNDSDPDGDAIQLASCSNASVDTSGVIDPATSLPGLIVQQGDCAITTGTSYGAWLILGFGDGRVTISTDGFPFVGLSTGETLVLTFDYVVVDGHGGQATGSVRLAILGASPA